MRLMRALSFVFIMTAALLAGCGEIRRETKPVYQFEFGRTNFYKAAATFNITADMGLLKYSGTIDFRADVEMTAVDTNELGYKLLVDIKNPDVKCGNPQISTAIYIALNMVRSWFSSFYISKSGALTVFYEGKKEPALLSIGTAIFPDFTDMDAVYRGYDFQTNFGMKLQSREFIVVYRKHTGFRSQDSGTVTLDNDLRFNTFDKNDFAKSVEPPSFGFVNFRITDIFDTARGRLASKKASMDLSLILPFTQGILTYNVSLQGNAVIDLFLDEKAI